jgi:hypothetical protein
MLIARQIEELKTKKLREGDITIPVEVLKRLLDHYVDGPIVFVELEDDDNEE